METNLSSTYFRNTLIQGSYMSLKPLNTLEFQKSDFKALKVLEINFWSLKVFDFLLKKIKKY